MAKFYFVHYGEFISGGCEKLVEGLSIAETTAREMAKQKPGKTVFISPVSIMNPVQRFVGVVEIRRASLIPELETQEKADA